MLCAWARSLGARVIGTVSSEEKARVAREHGCEQVIVSRDYRFADAVRRLWPEGAELIVDGLGEGARDQNFAALARCGHWISLGQASGTLQPISPDWLVQKSATFSRPVVFDFVACVPMALSSWHGKGRGTAAETIHAPWMLSIRCLTCRPCCKR